MMAMSRPVDSPVHANRTGPYSEETGGDRLRINAFNHDDVEVDFDPLSTNRRSPGTWQCWELWFSEAPPEIVLM